MAHHEPLKALGPIDWTDVAEGDLPQFLTTTFSHAQTIIDSLPVPPSQPKPAQHARARSQTDSAALPPAHLPSASTPQADNEPAAHAVLLQKEWKEIKVPPKDNPMNISVYKLASKDGRGAWFARRSVHEGISFDKFQLGLEREFGETMKNSTGVGTANVRGIGAEKKAEELACEGVGKADVWVLSAQFPGPTTPRDFITLLLSGAGQAATSSQGRKPRQFMVVSKPCKHPECAPRTGYIRASYESVEMIREIPIDRPLRQVHSSADLPRAGLDTLDGQDHLSKEATLRAAHRRSARDSEQSLPHSMTELPPREYNAGSGLGVSEPEMAVEWMMVTRSDPGGSVPRFMVEKGTPGAIVNDAGLFTKWLQTKNAADFGEALATPLEEGAEGEATPALPPRPDQRAPGLPDRPRSTQGTAAGESIPYSGLYSIITGLVGGAASAVASHLPNMSYASAQETDASSLEEAGSDSDSLRSFASAPEPDLPLARVKTDGPDKASLRSEKSDESSSKASATPHEKQLKKLQERYRKLEEKTAKQQEKTLQGKENQADDSALAKLKEKHEREIARQEETYRKEAKKLEDKRRKDEKKAEERRRKEAEKEAKGNTALELERTRVERDMALKQIDILKEQVGALQSQNTELVAQLGKLGVTRLAHVLGGGAEEKSAA